MFNKKSLWIFIQRLLNNISHAIPTDGFKCGPKLHNSNSFEVDLRGASELGKATITDAGIRSIALKKSSAENIAFDNTIIEPFFLLLLLDLEMLTNYYIAIFIAKGL